MSHTIESLIEDSKKLAEKMGHGFVTIDHLSIAIMQIPSIRDFFDHAKLNPERIAAKLETAVQNMNLPSPKAAQHGPIETMAFTALLRDIKKQSIIEQLQANDLSIEPYFILIECLSFDETIFEAVLLAERTTSSDLMITLQSYMNDLNYELDIAETQSEMSEEPQLPNSNSGRGKSNKNPLEEFCSDLTKEAQEGKIDPMIGRAVELQDMIQVLARKTKKNLILTGDAGVGKTQLANGLALAIVSGNVPETLKDSRIFSLNVSSLLAGTKFRGDFEARVDSIIKELKEHPEIIMFIDEIHTIMGAGSSGSGAMDMSNMLKPALSSGQIRVIGATTYDEYRLHFEKDAALTRRFMKLDILEPTIDETRQIINGIKKNYETFHNVKYTKDTVNAVIDLAQKYIHNKKFPDKAIDLLDAAGARNKVSANPKATLERSDIEYEVSRISNLPLEIIACKESQRMMGLEKSLLSRVFGQDTAVTALVDNVMVARAGLRKKASIQGAFLFVGPSGTGKTEISKALSDSLGLELLRFDMAEYAQEHTVSKLIGSPPGYVGHDAGNGALLDRVEEHPNSVILFDEIEKAHPKVLLTLLSLLDEGHLTGSHGKTVYFNECTVIMTTNLGAKDADVRAVGFGSNKGTKDGIDIAVKEHLAPEFINRLDAIIKFNNLSDASIHSIVGKFINILNEDIKDKKVKVTLDAKAVKWLVAHGTEKGMGARPMERCIHENIKRQLAKEMLFGSLVNGGKAKFTVKDDKIVMIKIEPVDDVIEVIDAVEVEAE